MKRIMILVLSLAVLLTGCDIRCNAYQAYMKRYSYDTNVECINGKLKRIYWDSKLSNNAMMVSVIDDVNHKEIPCDKNTKITLNRNLETFTAETETSIAIGNIKEN